MRARRAGQFFHRWLIRGGVAQDDVVGGVGGHGGEVFAIKRGYHFKEGERRITDGKDAESPKPWFWGPLFSRRVPARKGPSGGRLLVVIRCGIPLSGGSRAENETGFVFCDAESGAAVGLEGIGAGCNGGSNLGEKRC